jgi:hypothetical protein
LYSPADSYACPEALGYGFVSAQPLKQRLREEFCVYLRPL